MSSPLQEIPGILESRGNDLRVKLSESLYCTHVPVLKFLPDRAHILDEVGERMAESNIECSLFMIQEMNHLFKIADYGMQYRAVSQTASVLGSMSETGQESNEEKVSQVSGFILRMQERMAEKRRLREERLREEAKAAEESREIPGSSVDAPKPSSV